MEKTSLIFGRYCENNPSNTVSEKYWKFQANRIFEKNPGVTLVEIVRSGRKIDSKFTLRGAKYTSHSHVYTIIASTGGRWGKSRREFGPISL